jgi:hypothetical protein
MLSGSGIQTSCYDLLVEEYPPTEQELQNLGMVQLGLK